MLAVHGALAVLARPLAHLKARSVVSGCDRDPFWYAYSRGAAAQRVSPHTKCMLPRLGHS